MRVPVIYTDRLILRPSAEHDVNDLHCVWTDSEVRRYLFDDAVIDLSKAREIVRSSIESAAGTGLGLWAIHLNPNTPLLGFCGLRLFGDIPEAELLYGLLPRYWGQGFATEACMGALSYLWSATPFEKVYARTDPPNEKSVAVMRRLGMRQDEIQRGPNGQLLTTYVLDRPCHFLAKIRG